MTFRFFSKDFNEHVQHVKLVLRWLLENRFFVKTEKCEFHVRRFLGYIIEQGQVNADPAKVKAVVDWPTRTIFSGGLFGTLAG